MSEANKRPRVLLMLTGSVASIKAVEVVQELIKAGCEVRVIASRASTHFFPLRELEDVLATQTDCTPVVPDLSVLRSRPAATALDGATPYEFYYSAAHALAPFVHFDADEWLLWRSLAARDPVLHIALRDWADVLLVAPASASFLARAAQGACSDLASCVLRAWRAPRPLVLAPAMNTAMWEHPATQRHLAQLAADFFPAAPAAVLVPPQAKLLACGDVGVGAMAAPALIAAAAAAAAARAPLPAGVSLIITNTPTCHDCHADSASATAAGLGSSAVRRATDVLFGAVLAFAAAMLIMRRPNLSGAE